MDRRTQIFERARNAEMRNLVTQNQSTLHEVRSALEKAARSVEATLAAAPSDYQLWRLPQLQRSIRQSLVDLTLDMSETGVGASTSAFKAGVDLLDTPMEAAGINLSAVLNQVDNRPLLAIRSFMTDRLRDVGGELARKINGELFEVIAGVKAPSKAITAVTRVIEGGRGRSLTIVRTEVGRACSSATQERLDQGREFLPGLGKQWRRSGKTHSRISHDLADGQIVATDEPFLVGGVPLMFPRDPSAPIKETVNCGCTSLPHMEDWDTLNPGVLPFTNDELARSENKRRVEEFRQSS